MAPKKPLTVPQRSVRTKVTVAGQTFDRDDLTLAEVSLCEDETGQSWLAANPYTSGKWALAILTRFLARSVGEEQAKATVGGYTIKEALGALELVEEDDRSTEFVEGIPVVDPKADTDDSATTG